MDDEKKFESRRPSVYSQVDVFSFIFLQNANLFEIIITWFLIFLVVVVFLFFFFRLEQEVELGEKERKGEGKKGTRAPTRLYSIVDAQSLLFF